MVHHGITVLAAASASHRAGHPIGIIVLVIIIIAVAFLVVRRRRARNHQADGPSAPGSTPREGSGPGSPGSGP
jgi:heme/copper-type cytochrome/quinol oxidase subunit 2